MLCLHGFNSTGASVNCPDCGSQNWEALSFCTACGEALPVYVVAPRSNQQLELRRQWDIGSSALDVLSRIHGLFGEVVVAPSTRPPFLAALGEDERPRAFGEWPNGVDVEVLALGRWAVARRRDELSVLAGPLVRADGPARMVRVLDPPFHPCQAALKQQAGRRVPTRLSSMGRLGASLVLIADTERDTVARVVTIRSSRPARPWEGEVFVEREFVLSRKGEAWSVDRAGADDHNALVLVSERSIVILSDSSGEITERRYELGALHAQFIAGSVVVAREGVVALTKHGNELAPVLFENQRPIRLRIDDDVEGLQGLNTPVGRSVLARTEQGLHRFNAGASRFARDAEPQSSFTRVEHEMASGTLYRVANGQRLRFRGPSVDSLLPITIAATTIVLAASAGNQFWLATADGPGTQSLMEFAWAG